VALCTDGHLRRELVAKGRQRAEAFSQTRQMAEEYWALFEEASGHIRHSETIYGLFGDGWASPYMVLEHMQGEHERTIEIDLSVPPFFPLPRNRIEAVDISGKVIGTMEIPTGEQRTFRFSIGPGEGKVRIRLRYSVRPAEILGGNDMRKVSAMVSAVRVRENGTAHMLFSRPRAGA
jgi:hypothetical protein